MKIAAKQSKTQKNKARIQSCQFWFNQNSENKLAVSLFYDTASTGLFVSNSVKSSFGSSFSSFSILYLNRVMQGYTIKITYNYILKGIAAQGKILRKNTTMQKTLFTSPVVRPSGLWVKSFVRIKYANLASDIKFFLCFQG